MTIGDGVAQTIEHQNAISGSSSSNNNNITKSMSMLSSPSLEGSNHQQKERHHALSTPMSAADVLDSVQTALGSVRDKLLMSLIKGDYTSTQTFNRFSAAATSSITADDGINSISQPERFRMMLMDQYSPLSLSISSSSSSPWDTFRTGTMAFWAFFYAPLWVTVYRLYNIYLPKGPTGVVARVGLTFLTSIPVNAAFYTYGTTVHHTREWWQQQQQSSNDDDKNSLLLKTPLVSSYQFDELREKVLAKLEAEMPTTVVRSAYCWIPFNFVTFSVVPPHVQPLTLMFGAVFWNCYLSLTQHRDIPNDVLDHHHLSTNPADHHVYMADHCGQINKNKKHG
jgi:hypothetical protein